MAKEVVGGHLTDTHMAGIAGECRRRGPTLKEKLLQWLGIPRRIRRPESIRSPDGVEAYFLGGPGNDYFRAWDGQRDSLNGGPGVESAAIDRFDRTVSVERR